MSTSLQKLESDIKTLSATLLPKLPQAMDAVHYASYGECGLAVEMLSDWCVGTEPEIVLSLEEFLQFFALVEQLASRNYWVDLLPLLTHESLRRLPRRCARLAEQHLGTEKLQNPQRASWLARVEAVINQARS